MQLPFFKKKKSANAEQASTAAKKPDVSLNNIVFYRMPEKFLRAAGAPTPKKSKTIGMLIMGIGGIVLVVGGYFLYRYIFVSTPTAPAPQSTTTQEQTEPPAATKENDQEPRGLSGDEEDVSDEITEEDTEADDNLSTEPIVQDCGIMAQALEADSGVSGVESDATLVCLGERLQDDCKQARAILRTSDFGNVEFAVLGLQNTNCLVQIDFPERFQLLNQELRPYANTYAQCAYAFATMTGAPTDPGAFAQYIYTQSTVTGFTDATTCVGTAVDVWREEQGPDVPTEPGTPITTFEPGVDTDGDGLTNVEEQTIFNTESTSIDTDGDTYTDADEVFNLYNPAGSGTLVASEQVSEYQHSSGYSVLYPAEWRTDEDVSAGSVRFFAGSEGSSAFIQILAPQPNDDNVSLLEWYAAVTSTSTHAITQSVETSKQGYQFLMSEDGLTAYLAVPGAPSGKVYVISYSPGIGSRIEFAATLRMVVHSFREN